MPDTHQPATSPTQPSPPTTTATTDHHAGHSRFTLELEFVQLLSNPLYLNHLAVQKYLDDPAFVRYLHYLQYWRRPQYVRFLQYPGPTLRALELLQVDAFRRDVVVPAVVGEMVRAGLAATITQEG